MSMDASTQTTPGEGSRTIAIQTGEHGIWILDQVCEKRTCSTKSFKPSKGRYQKGQSTQTRKNPSRQQESQTIKEAKPRKKTTAETEILNLNLDVITDDNIRNWMPRDQRGPKYRRIQKKLNELF